MGQKPWSEKRALIKQDGALLLNQLLLDEPEWSEEWGARQIKERGAGWRFSP